MTCHYLGKHKVCVVWKHNTHRFKMLNLVCNEKTGVCPNKCDITCECDYFELKGE